MRKPQCLQLFRPPQPVTGIALPLPFSFILAIMRSILRTVPFMAQKIITITNQQFPRNWFQEKKHGLATERETANQLKLHNARYKALVVMIYIAKRNNIYVRIFLERA
jgi:hypothetical protein